MELVMALDLLKERLKGGKIKKAYDGVLAGAEHDRERRKEVEGEREAWKKATLEACTEINVVPGCALGDVQPLCVTELREAYTLVARQLYVGDAKEDTVRGLELDKARLEGALNEAWKIIGELRSDLRGRGNLVEASVETVSGPPVAGSSQVSFCLAHGRHECRCGNVVYECSCTHDLKPVTVGLAPCLCGAPGDKGSIAPAKRVRGESRGS